MMRIRFPDDATERKALGFLAGRFSFKSFATGVTEVAADAAAALSREKIAFTEDKVERRPIIGITMDHKDDTPAPGVSGYYMLGFDYAKSVEKAGGLPIPIPYKTDHSLIPQFVDLLDGILFTGGNDLDPALYGETWHKKAVPIDPDRQNFELALLAEVEKRRTPALAICLGCQLFNVYRGGSLHQYIGDIEGKQVHSRGEESVRRHGIQIEPDSAVGRAIGKREISANTYHKQAVKEVGRGLKVTAMSDDGIIEGIEDPTMPLFAAVQWHPERLKDEQEHLAPFRLLVEKAREWMKHK